MGSKATRFKPGRSGNPSGRPKIIGHIRDLARQYAEDAIKTLAAIMIDEKAPPSARIFAANSLLDRGWGKATTYVESEANPFDALTLEEKRALLEAIELVRERAGSGGDDPPTTH